MMPEPEWCSAPSPFVDAARRLARLLVGYERNVRTAVDWVHPSWLDTLLPPGVPELAVDAPDRELLSLALVARLGVVEPPLESFSMGPAADLGAWTKDDALLVLKVRALLFRRGELRSWIDRPSRARVSEWLGEDATQLVLALQRLPDAPKIEQVVRAGLAQELAVLSAERLAWEGWCLFSSDGSWTEAGPSSLLRLALPREMPALRRMIRQAALGDAAQRADSERIPGQLKLWFPERTWSSGYERPA